jgi:hypothetical protein
MDRQKLVMVSSKVLNQMLTYRKYNRFFASYKEACESIKPEIYNFRTDAFRADISYHAQSSPRLLIRQFQSHLVNIAAKCLLAAGECGSKELFYDEVFSNFFAIVDELVMEAATDKSALDDTIINKWEDFEAGANTNHANTVLLYQVAANCVLLHHNIELLSNPVAYEVKK